MVEKHFIIKTNNNSQSKEVAEWLNNQLLKLNMKQDAKKPQWVFSIGGDGTLLEAINDFSHQLDTVVFIAINTGKIGFNTTFSVSHLKELVNLFKKQNLQIDYQDALQVNISEKNVFFAMNEIQVLRVGKTIRYNLFVDDVLLQQSQSSGFVVATKNGSTGFVKSIKGAVIFSNTNLMQFLEVAPVQHLLQHTINAPIIFDHMQHLKMQGDFTKSKLLIDGIEQPFSSDVLKIGLIKNKIKFLVNPQCKVNTTLKLRKMFINKE